MALKNGEKTILPIKYLGISKVKKWGIQACAYAIIDIF
jgi:hypothetical protein